MLYSIIKHVFIAGLLWVLASPAFALTFKIATLSPDGSSWMVEMRKGAEEIAKRTDNRVKFKFYPGGVMGDDSAVLRKIRFGQLQGGAFSYGTLNKFYPDIQIFSMLLKFNSLNEVDYVRQKMDPLIVKGLEDNGMVTFGLSEIGFGYLMSKKPINSISDLRRQKVWLLENNDISETALEAFDVSGIPLKLRDVLVALQTGMIDTVAASPVGAIALHWHTQVKYVVDLPLAYIYGALAINKKTFDKLSPADQTVVREVMSKVTKILEEKTRKDNISALQALRNLGIEFITPKPEVTAELRELIVPANKKLMATGRLSKELIEQLDTYLQQYRSTQANTHEQQ